MDIEKLVKLVEEKTGETIISVTVQKPIVFKCDCGKLLDKKYDPCCSLSCWYKKFT